MKKNLISMMLACFVSIPAFAGGEARNFDKEILSERLPSHTEAEDKVFNAGEWQADVFGTYADTDDGNHYRDGFGGGVGVNHFWTENWGAGLEGYWWEGSKPGDRWLHNVGANIFYRYPIQDLRLAPYVFVGPGGHFNGSDEASGHAGGGVEWRFLDNIGVFADARYTFTTGPDDFALYRTGLRFVF